MTKSFGKKTTMKKKINVVLSWSTSCTVSQVGLSMNKECFLRDTFADSNFFLAGSADKFNLYPLMVVDSAEASLRLALQQKPQQGCHSILLKGRSIMDFTPNELESVWLYTGLFVPPLDVHEDDLPFGEGVYHLWDRTCLWYFCSQIATRNINNLVQYCNKREREEWVAVDWPLLTTAHMKVVDDSTCTFATEPQPVSYMEPLTPAEKSFMGDCDVRIPRTLFHLSFWYV